MAFTPLQAGIVASSAQASVPPTTYSLFSWGLNDVGELGIGNRTNKSSPVQVGALTTWTSLGRAGAYHSFAIKSDGTLWGWGQNSAYQLGDGSGVNKSSPIQIGSATNWSKVAGGMAYTLGLRKDGTLWAWGADASGETGTGTGDTGNITTPVQIGSATDWTDVAAGEYCSFGIRGGKLFTWGDNQYGQLGLGDRTNRSSPTQVGSGTNWLAVGAGSYFGFAIKTDGTLWALGGDNSQYNLGLGDTVNRSSPVQVGALTTWTQLDGGDYHALGLAGGALYAWGSNTYGECGTGNTNGVTTPVQIGSATNWTSVCAGDIHNSYGVAGGKAFAWGESTSGQLGLGGPLTNKSSPTQIGSGTGWKDVRGFYSSILGLTT